MYAASSFLMGASFAASYCIHLMDGWMDGFLCVGPTRKILFIVKKIGNNIKKKKN